jgi:NAD(P)-dependent dehydrogenase (short-subunit alcohol dehydrogenase family)
MQGKTVIVTGATNGIGKAIAHDLAKQGARTVIIGRSAQKCSATSQEIRQQTGNDNIHYYVADLSKQADIRTLASTLNDDLDRLDVLINNAGAWFTTRQESADGIEMTWALNHLNYFLLTHELLDALKQTAQQHGEARIINQSSIAHLDGRIHWDDVQFERTWQTEGKGQYGAGWAVYSQSKLANVLHALTLARKLKDSGVTANAVHPGVVVTGFTQNNGLIYKLAAPFRRLRLRTTPHDGAAPAVYLASSVDAHGVTGKYYGPPHTEEEVNPLAHDIDVQERLWELSLQHVDAKVAVLT